jgi:hypothetical protein
MASYDRVVTIVANGAYAPNKDKFPGKLPKAEADGKAMAKFFKHHNFTILNEKAMYNQNLEAMQTQAIHHVDIINEKKPEVAAYYFSGHGLEDEKNNWLLPVNYVAPAKGQSARMNNIKCFSPQVRS